MLLTSILLTSILLIGGSSATGATLAGTVRDSEGAVIAKAHIVIHWDPSGANYLKDNIGIKEDIISTTDSNGGFSVDLPAGFYDVFVSAISFSPICDKIRLKGNEPRKYEVKLKVSPVTSKELD
jgi:hypothetical protein